MKNFLLLIGIQILPLALIIMAGVIYACDHKAGWGVFWILVLAAILTDGNAARFDVWRDRGDKK